MQERRTETVDGPVDVGVAASVLATGTIVDGRYEIERLLGHGGSALVYAARDLQLRVPVALKVLRRDRLNETSIKRLRREVTTARRAADPRLVRVFDIVEHADVVYLTMELVDAPTLRSRLAAGPLPIADAIAIGIEIAEALAALHALGIVHRDVKPGNVLLNERNEVKLADFGLAMHVNRDESRLTQNAGLIGTLEYLSPEQALGQDVDARSDLYSLGVVLFEMLTGRLPFETETTIGAVVAHLQHRAPSVRSFRPEAPRWLSRLVAVLLEKNPRQRIHDAPSVAAILKRKRMPFRRRLRWSRLAIAPAAAAALIAGWFAFARPHALARIVGNGASELTAVDGSGRAIWSLRDVKPERCAAIVREHGKPAYVAAIQDLGRATDEDRARDLLLLDPANGSVLRRVRLPYGASVFPEFAPNFHVSGIATVDVNGDGNEIIAVSYVHATYWPSYIVVYDPLSEANDIVFFSSGHHHFGTAADLNGDGRKELVLIGINNKMGWHPAVAAIDLAARPIRGGNVGHYYSGYTPDSAYTPDASRSLLWYALMPFGHPTRIVSVDQPARRLTVEYDDGHVDRVSFDGFTNDAVEPGAVRNRRRSAAYQELRESSRLASGGFPQEAIAAADRARADAEGAGDPVLVEWTRRQRAATLVRLGHVEEGNREFEGVFASSANPSDIAFDAGRALHLAGSLDRAAGWYHRGLGIGSSTLVGRGRYEFLEGEVLALGELGRWDEARRAVQQFNDQLPIEAVMGTYFQQYIDWRTGVAIDPITPVGESTPDEMRYWNLEFQWRNHAMNPDVLLPAIDEELKRSSITTLLYALKADVLRETGRPREAWPLAQRAYASARSERSTDTVIRAHFSVIEQRWLQCAKADGRPAR